MVCAASYVLESLLRQALILARHTTEWTPLNQSAPQVIKVCRWRILVVISQSFRCINMLNLYTWIFFVDCECWLWILACDLSIIWMHKHAELVYIWIFWVANYECWLWIWMCPVNLSLIWMSFLLYLCVNLLECILWDCDVWVSHGTPSYWEERHLLVRVAMAHQLFFIFMFCLYKHWSLTNLLTHEH